MILSLSLAAAAVRAQPGEGRPLRRVVALLDYVSNDYARAVGEHGEVLSEAEHAEQIGFVQDAASEVREFPDEERKEVRTIFARKGFRGRALEQMVQHVTADPVFWVDTMMTEELGLSAVPTGAPLRSGLVVASAYALGAAFPVIPYALPVQVSTAFALSVGCTLVALFAAGAAKTFMTGRPWLRSGLETVLVGAIAAATTFIAGKLIAG